MTVSYLSEGGAGTSTATASTSFTITVASAIAAGKLAVMMIGSRESTATLSAMTDSRGNTWNRGLDSPASGGNTVACMAWSVLTTGLQVSDTLSLTFSAAIGTGRGYYLEAFDSIAASPLDQTAVGVNTATTGATTQADEVAVGIMCASDLSSPIIAPTGYTAFTTGNQNSGGAQARQVIGFYKILSSTGTQTASVNPGTIGNTATILATFKGASGPTTYNQSVSGSLTPAGSSPVFLMQRALPGGLTFAGAAPTFATARTLPGAHITPTGALSSAKAFLRTVTATITPVGALATTRSYVRTLTSIFAPFAGTNLYPDPALYPDPNLWPYGGAILFQLNRTLIGAIQAAGALSTHSAVSRVFTAILRPQVVFFKTSARVFLAAELTSASIVAARVSRTFAQALFASLRAAGSLQTGINPGFNPPGGGGYGVPMPDRFFQRYQPTLRRQKVKV